MANTIICQLTVYGEPQPAGSKRGFARGGHVQIVDANPKSRQWKDHVAQTVGETYNGTLHTGPVTLQLHFYRVRPKSHYGTGRNANNVKSSAPHRPTSKPDTLKLARGVEDALTGVVYRDDAQVVSLHLHKWYGDPARVEITVVESE